MRSWSAVNDTVTYPLKRRDLENFLDFDDAGRRVERIRSNPHVSIRRRQIATELLEAFEQGTDVRA